MSSLIKSTVRVARKHVKATAGARSKKNKLPRIIKVPKTGGSLTLIPILAGLSALGTLAGGVANIVRTIRGIRSNNGGSQVHLGKGMYLSPYKNGGSYTIVRKSRTTVGGGGGGGTAKRKKTVVKRKKSNANKKNNKKSRKIKSIKTSLRTKN